MPNEYIDVYMKYIDQTQSPPTLKSPKIIK